MARGFDSWQETVRNHGYTTEREMLTDLYERSGLSVRSIAKLLEREYSTVKYRLEMHGIQLRDRGGANHRKAEE